MEHPIPQLPQKNDLLARITSDADTLHGKPRIKGTRIPVYLIVQLIAAGESVKTILEDYPSLTEQDVRAALFYAAKLTEYEAYAI
ncbi:MAG TPA: DUF433 domain-containing protein [Candidatus Kapabacteria bacterium]|jgi:uncharacterized protein (DUF433 family)|nr:DUF433 domain-containing protein [Candidatus Kapabacteria bacterium]